MYILTNSPIHEFKVLQKGISSYLLKTLKNILNVVFKDILQQIHELENSFFDVTNRLFVLLFDEIKVLNCDQNRQTNADMTGIQKNSPIHEFKVLKNVYKIKQGLKCF